MIHISIPDNNLCVFICLLSIRVFGHIFQHLYTVNIILKITLCWIFNLVKKKNFMAYRSVICIFLFGEERKYIFTAGITAFNPSNKSFGVGKTCRDFICWTCFTITWNTKKCNPFYFFINRYTIWFVDVRNLKGLFEQGTF